MANTDTPTRYQEVVNNLAQTFVELSLELGRGGRDKASPLFQPVSIQGQLVEQVQVLRYLGIEMDTSLSYSQHAYTTYKKAQLLLHLLRNISGQQGHFNFGLPLPHWISSHFQYRFLVQSTHRQTQNKTHTHSESGCFFLGEKNGISWAEKMLTGNQIFSLMLHWDLKWTTPVLRHSIITTQINIWTEYNLFLVESFLWVHKCLCVWSNHWQHEQHLSSV